MIKPFRSFSSLKAHSGLIVILLVYTVLAVIHSVVVPLTVGNDEWAHFLYVRYIAEERRLPATISERDQAGYKSDAPGLYHLLVAATTAAIEPTRLLRPLNAPRRYLADNVIDSPALVHTAVEQLPYRGEVLIWHIGRLLSILWGLVLISLTYGVARQIFRFSPFSQRRALLASALAAFTPAILFHSSVLSYESMSAALAALFLWSALVAIQQPGQWQWWVCLGILTGLSITTKYSAVLLPVELIFVVWLAFRSRAGPQYQPSKWLGRLAVAGGATLLAASWWFGYAIWHFNTIEAQGPVAGVLQPLLVGDASDTTSVQVAGFLFGQEAVEETIRPPLARDYPQLLLSFLESFWAAPVAGKVVGTPWLPLMFSLAALLGVAGLWPVWRQADSQSRLMLILLVFHASLILPLLLVRIAFSFDPREVVQGRHVLLPAVPAVAILLVWGWEQWSAKLGPLIVSGLFLWSVLGQLVWAVMAYPAPVPVWPEDTVTFDPAAASRSDYVALTGSVGDETTTLNSALFDSIRLRTVQWRYDADFLEIVLWWRALAFMEKDYLVELRLTDKAGKLMGYSLGHPVQGRYPTRAWEPGDTIRDVHQLALRGVTAGHYNLQFRLLNRLAEPLPKAQEMTLGQIRLDKSAGRDHVDSCATFPRREGWTVSQGVRPGGSFMVIADESPTLRIADDPTASLAQAPLHTAGEFHVFVVEPGWPDSARLYIGTMPCENISFDIPPRSFTVPDIAVLLEANFNHEIELLGYELPTRRIQPGQRLPLTLYWRALDYIGQDYRLFANPLDADQQRWGGYDRRPHDGYSTLRWVPGEVIADPFGIPIDPAAPPGVYAIDFGFYRETDDGAESLPLIQGEQQLAASSIRLGPIKVGGPPPELVVAKAEPQIVRNQSLGGQIRLLGYDLDSDPPPGAELRFRLYWRAEARPTADYTVFLHLRDANNQNVAQQDNPPADGRYPTSLWDEAEIIMDILMLPVNDVSPGRYTPVVGLYNFTTGDRLLTPDNPANEILLEPVIIP